MKEYNNEITTEIERCEGVITLYNVITSLYSKMNADIPKHIKKATEQYIEILSKEYAKGIPHKDIIDYSLIEKIITKE